MGVVGSKPHVNSHSRDAVCADAGFLIGFIWMIVKATALLDYIYPAAYISAERKINVQNFKLHFNIPYRFIQTAALSHSDWALCKEDLPPLHARTAPQLFKGSKNPSISWLPEKMTSACYSVCKSTEQMHLINARCLKAQMCSFKHL